MLEREEIAIAPLWNNNTAGLAQQGLPISFVKPADGPVAILSFFSGFTDSTHPDLVAEWLNGILSQEYQAHAAGAPYYFGPTVTGVAVPPEAKPFTPSSAEEIAALPPRSCPSWRCRRWSMRDIRRWPSVRGRWRSASARAATRPP